MTVRSKSSGKTTIKIPKPLYNRIGLLIEGAGYNSVTDFIVYVLRDLAGERELEGVDIEPLTERGREGRPPEPPPEPPERRPVKEEIKEIKLNDLNAEDFIESEPQRAQRTQRRANVTAQPGKSGRGT